MDPTVAKFDWLARHMAAFIVALFVVAALVAGFIVWSRHDAHATLRIDGKSFALELASTPQSQELGLGERASLPANQGMLFAFGNTAVECFWMKDMNFPLDIIWLNAGKQIVHIEQNVSPDTYPHSFCPNDPTKYVIELNAGAAQTTDMHDGQKLNF